MSLTKSLTNLNFSAPPPPPEMPGSVNFSSPCGPPCATAEACLALVAAGVQARAPTGMYALHEAALSASTRHLITIVICGVALRWQRAPLRGWQAAGIYP
eukprot:scaffold52526_cov54-Phaeocystis_antarctica.AAC.2